MTGATHAESHDSGRRRSYARQGPNPHRYPGQNWNVKYLLDIAHMAASNIGEDLANPFQTLIYDCTKKLEAALADLNNRTIAAVARHDREAAALIDPVFAAIKHHKAALTIWRDAEARADRVLATETGRKVTKADTARSDAAYEAEQKAMDVLLKTPPQTMVGLRAVVRHMVDDLHGSDVPESTEGYFLAALLDNCPLFADGIES
jgi:hypothetical protein